MESSILNAAHERQRRAEALLQERRFEEAAKCHEMVASLFEEARSQLESSSVHLRNSGISSKPPPTVISSFHSVITLESLALQRDYHKRQAAVVRMKQAQYEEYKTTLENQQREILSKQAPKETDKGAKFMMDKMNESLRQAIYRTIEEQDSLINLISLPSNADKAFKLPKDAGTVIEELKTVNCQLRCLIKSLLNQLEIKEEEVRLLTEQLTNDNLNDENRLGNAHSLRHIPLPSLPPLTPLDMPLFDFTST